MTIIFIENAIGSGQIIRVVETFRQQTVVHVLRPGENGRFAVNRCKSIVVDEGPAAQTAGFGGDQPLLRCA